MRATPVSGLRWGGMTPRTFFPGRLLRTLEHAQRFGRFLERLEAGRHDPTRRAWLRGRRREIVSFVDRIGRDYRSRRLDETGATACVEAYLYALHAGVATELGEHVPECCGASAAITVVAARPTEDTPTAVYVQPRAPSEPRHPRRSPPDITSVDIEADQLLAGLVTRVE
jgi:hypothetical protein